MSETPSTAAPAGAEAAFRSMLHVFGLLRRVMDAYFIRYGISGAQWGVLCTLWRAQEDDKSGLTLTDLGKRLLIRPPSVTGAVDRLVRLGMVQKSSSESDLRSKFVNLTPSGQELVNLVLKDHGLQIRSVLGDLTDDEQANLAGLMARLGVHLTGMLGPGNGGRE